MRYCAGEKAPLSAILEDFFSALQWVSVLGRSMNEPKERHTLKSTEQYILALHELYSDSTLMSQQVASPRDLKRKMGSEWHHRTLAQQ